MILRKRQQYITALKHYEDSINPTQYKTLNEKDFYFDKMENLEIEMIEAKKEKTKSKRIPKIRFIMSEGVTKMCKFLFVHRNKHKLSFCNFMTGLHNSMRRVILVPLLYSSFTIQNPINILTLLPCIYYSFRSHHHIEDDLKIFMPIFSFIFGVIFSFEQLKKNDFFKTLLSSLSNKKYEKSGLSFFSGFLLVVAIAFGIRVYMLYFVSFRLFIIRKKFKTLYFYFGSSQLKE